MADDDHIAQPMRGVAAWNTWRDENPDIHPDLGGRTLTKANLSGAHPSKTRTPAASVMR
jgi:hypothetical protein